MPWLTGLLFGRYAALPSAQTACHSRITLFGAWMARALGTETFTSAIQSSPLIRTRECKKNFWFSEVIKQLTVWFKSESDAATHSHTAKWIEEEVFKILSGVKVVKSKKTVFCTDASVKYTKRAQARGQSTMYYRFLFMHSCTLSALLIYISN